MALPLVLDFVKDPDASPDRMRRVSEYLVARFQALETPAKSADAMLKQLQAIGLERIADALGPVYAQATALRDQLDAVLADYMAQGLPAARVVTDASHRFLTDAQIADLQARVTAADLTAAIAGVKGTADAAHDTLGELAALVDAATAAGAANATAIAGKADAAATTTALGDRLRLDALVSSTAARQTIGRLNLNAASNDDMRALGRFLAKLSGTALQTGTLSIDEFKDLTGLNAAASTGLIYDATSGFVSNVDLNAIALLHCDGANGATTTADVKGHTFSLVNATISTAQSKFGGSSLFFNGSNAYAGFSSNADFDLSAGDFTIEGWFYSPIAANNSQQIFFQIGPFYIYLYGGSISCGVDGADYMSTSGIANSTWYHFALARVGPTLALYLNGTKVGSTSNNPFPSGSPGPLFGTKTGGASWFNGYLDEIRITKGVARYNANFTPPAAPFSLSGALDMKSAAMPWAGTGGPSKASLYAAIKVTSGTLDLNNNLVAKATRDGVGYATFALQQVLTLGGWTFVKADGLDLSGLPAGLSPAYEIIASAALGLQIDTVEFGYGA